MVPYGTIGYYMVPYGIMWYHMVSYGTIWYHMVPYGTIWFSSVPFFQFSIFFDFAKMFIFQFFQHVQFSNSPFFQFSKLSKFFTIFLHGFFVIKNTWALMWFFNLVGSVVFQTSFCIHCFTTNRTSNGKWSCGHPCRLRTADIITSILGIKNACLR